VRFEDTDAARSDAAYEEGLLRDLAWLGLSWTEGPDVGGPCGPYRQSERSGIYARALDRLAAEGRVYRCFCEQTALEGSRTADDGDRRPSRYRGDCRSIPPDEEALAALAAPAAAGALALALETTRSPDGLDLRDALRAAGLPPREALPALRAALTGRAHGLPVATLLAFLGTAEAASRLELALRA
jgi:glutamyl-tRNA synthetase